MFYIKKKISDDIEVKINLEDGAFYTRCSKCGKEMLFDNQDMVSILDEFSLEEVEITCEDCINKR